MYIEVEVDVYEVLRECSIEELEAEIARRKKKPEPEERDVLAMKDAVYQWARSLADVPQAVRDYFWHIHGRAL